MGIKGLNKFLQAHLPKGKGIYTIKSSTLQDSAIAVDTSIYMYKFITAIKNSGTDIYSQDGQIITHLHAILNRTFALLKHKIKPIFVFDGKASKEKNELLKERQTKKLHASSQIDDLRKRIKEIKTLMKPMAETTEDIENYKILFAEFMTCRNKLKSMLKQSSSVSSDQMNECKELLRILNIPVIEALQEADPVCAHLTKINLADSVSSEDMDILTFGAKQLVTKLSAKDTCTKYVLSEILEGLDVTLEQYIDISILLGCDYTCTISGLGPKKIYNEIKTHGNIEGIIRTGKYSVSDEFDYVTARKMFSNPKVNNIEDIEWGIPDYERLREFLLAKAYTEDEINKICDVFQGGYYSVISGEKSLQSYRHDCVKYKRKKTVVKFESDDED